MSNNISFFTAVNYGENKTFTQSVLEKVDNYFYLGGKKAYVIQGNPKQRHEEAILAETNSSLLARFGKFMSYFTFILPLAMLITKTLLRSTHTFRLIDLEKELEKGINISKNTISKIEVLLPQILRGQNHDDEIIWLSKDGANLVFKLKEDPHLVFKIAAPTVFYKNNSLPTCDSQKIDKRFKNMLKAKKVCLINQLGLLVIPQAKKFTVATSNNHKYTFIAEDNLNLKCNESTQEQLYHTYSKNLNETTRQLAIFIAKTGFNDVSWRNIPILNEPPEYRGPRRVGLIDVEHLESAVKGFNGDWNGSRGLIRCATSEEQIDIIIKEAYKQGVDITQTEKPKEERLYELKEDAKLENRYKNKGIITGKEPIEVDLESLNLTLKKTEQINVYVEDKTTKYGFRTEKKTVTLKEVAEDVIKEINNLSFGFSRQLQAF